MHRIPISRGGKGGCEGVRVYGYGNCSSAVSWPITARCAITTPVGTEGSVLQWNLAKTGVRLRKLRGPRKSSTRAPTLDWTGLDWTDLTQDARGGNHLTSKEEERNGQFSTRSGPVGSPLLGANSMMLFCAGHFYWPLPSSRQLLPRRETGSIVQFPPRTPGGPAFLRAPSDITSPFNQGETSARGEFFLLFRRLVLRADDKERASKG